MKGDVTQSSTIETSNLERYSPDAKSTDGVSLTDENYYDNQNFSTYYGYYSSIALMKKAIDAFATWVLGKGYETDSRTQVTLNNIQGRGDEDFADIMWNMLVIKKVNGDSYAEVIRADDGRLINIKPLNPENIRVVYNKKGIIKHYEDRRTGNQFPTNKILHFCNDRLADELGGTSVVPAVKFAVEAKQEAMERYKRILYLSTVRILYIDENDKTRLSNAKESYKDGIEKGDIVIFPFSKQDGEFQDLTVPPVGAFLEWMRYLDNEIFLDIGTPKVIMGSVDSIPESGGKISYLSYEQIYSRETRNLEADLWNQLGIKIKINPPASIAEGVTDEAAKNKAQTGFQPNDINAAKGK